MRTGSQTKKNKQPELLDQNRAELEAAIISELLSYHGSAYMLCDHLRPLNFKNLEYRKAFEAAGKLVVDAQPITIWGVHKLMVEAGSSLTFKDLMAVVLNGAGYPFYISIDACCLLLIEYNIREHAIDLLIKAQPTCSMMLVDAICILKDPGEDVFGAIKGIAALLAMNNELALARQMAEIDENSVQRAEKIRERSVLTGLLSGLKYCMANYPEATQNTLKKHLSSLYAN
jgi:hypothetical protein